MITGLAQIRGTCSSLSQVNMTYLHDACNPADVKDWSNAALESARFLRRFAAQLRGEEQ